MIISTNLGYLGSWIGRCFLKKKSIVSKSIKWYPACCLGKTINTITIAAGVIRHPMSPKRILNVDLSYLPKSYVQNISYRFMPKHLLQILGLTGSCIEVA